MNRNRLFMRNIVISFFFSVFNFALAIIEVKLFLIRYGSVVNGLVQTGYQASQYLSLIESGICAAFLYHFYKPLGEGNYYKVSSLYKGFNYSMHKVVLMMLIASMVIFSIIPLAIQDKTLGYRDSFIVLLLIGLRIIAPYYVSLAPKYMLIAREKKYKAEIVDGLTLALVYLGDIIMMALWTPPIPVLLVLDLLIVVGISLLCRIMMNKEYKGLLMDNVEMDRSPAKMKRDLFALNISSLAFNSSSNLILAIFMPSLTIATIYSSYNRIVSTIINTVQKVIEGTTASIGIKISRNDNNVYSVYCEILSATQFLSSVISIVFIVCINKFIELWIGSEYLIDHASVFLFGLALYGNMVLPSYYVAKDACGLFKECRNFSIAQSVINIVLSMILVKPLGITGILLSIVACRFLISIPFNYALIYRFVFPGQHANWLKLIANIGYFILISLIIPYVVSQVNTFTLNIWNFIIQIMISFIIAFLAQFVYMWLLDKNFKSLIGRIRKMHLLCR